MTHAMTPTFSAHFVRFDKVLARLLGRLMLVLLVSFSAQALLLAEEGAAEGGETETTTEESAVKAYPGDLCLVSDEKLGSMGEPYVFTEEGMEIKFCCRGCVGSFNRNKAEYMAKLQKMHEGDSSDETEAAPSEEHDHSTHDHGDHGH